MIVLFKQASPFTHILKQAATFRHAVTGDGIGVHVVESYELCLTQRLQVLGWQRRVTADDPALNLLQFICHTNQSYVYMQ